MSNRLRPSRPSFPSRSCAAALGLVVATAGPALALCGDANSSGTVTSSDALFTLRAVVGQGACDPMVCDVDASGQVKVNDALLILRSSADLPPELTCPDGDATPDDPLYDDLWGLRAIDAPGVWPRRRDCSGVIVAVADSGTDYFHDDLVANLWRNPDEIPFNGKDDDGNGFKDDVYGWDFARNDEFPWDRDGHGTHVAGTIGAAANTTGVVGVCWNATIMTVRFLNEFGFGFASDSLQAIDYARKNGAKVINNSWGGGPFDSGEYFAFNAASDADIVLVVAAGNDGIDNDLFDVYPVKYLHPTQVNVAATDEEGALASFSNYGFFSVHVAAPGVEIVSTLPRDEYGDADGTSMAAPHVAGAAALLRAEFPSLSAVEVRQILVASSVPSPDLAGLVRSGGVVNLPAAFEMADDIVGGNLSFEPVAQAAQAAPPSVVARRFVRAWADGAAKYPNLREVVEERSDGSSVAATMAADHVVVTLDDEAAVAAIEAAGLSVLRRLATDKPTVLVAAPDGVEAAEWVLQGVDGVAGVSPDYVLRAR